MVRTIRWLVMTLAMTLALLASTQGAAQTEAEDAQRSSKLSGYLKCYNEQSSRVRDSHDRYYQWVQSPERGPTGRERIVYGLYSLYDPAGCRQKLAVSLAASPPLPDLDAAAAQWERALVQVHAVIGEAYDYYDLGDYEDDGLARGKQLHPRLNAAWEEFFVANQTFSALLDEELDAIRARQLARLADKPGAEVAYHIRHYMLLAEDAHDLGVRSLSDDFDAAAFAGAVEALDRGYRDLEAAISAHPGQVEGMHMLSSYQNAARDYLKAVKELDRRQRKGNRFDTGERMLIEAHAAQMVEGHPAKLTDEYNDLVGDYNRL
ncbi:MAG TPA: YiiG family protein [Xanthomonadaceae bacterium]|nr:YiiG family protein [Xanthomonadaceae bacterium]